MVATLLLNEATQASPQGVQAIIGATELSDIRVDEIEAGPLLAAGEGMSFRLGRGLPNFILDDGDASLMVRLEHVLECIGPKEDDPSTNLRVVHVLTFDVLADLTVESADVSAWIQTNVYFMVYPYVRQIFTTLTSAMGLPPVVLGYMRRDDWPEFGDNDENDSA